MSNNENRFFQWVVGEKKGQICIFDKIEQDDGYNYIVFKDGSRIKEEFVAPLNQKTLTNMMMAEIDHPNNCWQFKTEIVGEETDRTELDWETQIRYDVPSVTEIMSGGQKMPVKRKLVTLIPPRPTAPRTSNFGYVTQQAPPPPPIEPVITKQEIEKKEQELLLTARDIDPVYILMSKAKKSQAEINVFMSIYIPPKNLYDIAKESFDKGDDKFIKYIVDEVETITIKNALYLALKNLYENDNK